ncbi:hypothetical protein K488DRAFT_53810 [Vararia minispora EC-137]|uniref:Uncharacterized protein n=1 Tax=Vararia minispora EC-137 TaxID=1314806 RepID=A0ACB8QG82_9AGAM|nr:hypothetical protein K488DRAFT_53810 [Vararia minispora EC-137]
MLVVDIMHEFELGVWKSLLLHLIRILNSLGTSKVQEFNECFRQIDTFGASTIRKFSGNVSELKKLAMRDFEDILQCCIPCFEGLLPEEHDSSVQDLLYLSVYWHSLAKCRMHSDTPLHVLEDVTDVFMHALRYFHNVTCTAFNTVETDKEYAARQRAVNRRNSKRAGNGTGSAPTTGGKQPKTFNMNTYKLHSLPDYPSSIRRFGTTDSGSTQIGEGEHRIVKRRYARTNRRDVEAQLVQLDVLENAHQRMYQEFLDTKVASTGDPEMAEGGSLAAARQRAYKSDAEQMAKPYIVAEEERPENQVNLNMWLREREQASDPAFQDFEQKLKTHLLARHKGEVIISDEPDYADEDLNQVVFHRGLVYQHATLTVNYTTYDIRRDSDLINGYDTGQRQNHCDIMMFSNEDPPSEATEAPCRRPPFWYARVLGVYHANVYFPGATKHTRLDFLFVRWFGLDPEWVGGPRTKRLDRIGYVPDGDASGAFGFLDPARILRACHLIPAFAIGRTTSLLSPLSRFCDSLSGDWTNYYVSRFVDRDMMMRYLGWGIGHRNPPDFPHEADDLPRTTMYDKFLTPAREHIENSEMADGEGNWDGIGELDEDEETNSLEDEDSTHSSDEEGDEEGAEGAEDFAGDGDDEFEF